MSFRPDEVEEEGAAKDGGDVNSRKDVVTSNADIVVVVFVADAGSVLLDPFLLAHVTRQGIRAQRFRDDTEDHCQLVNDELCSSTVVSGCDRISMVR